MSALTQHRGVLLGRSGKGFADSAIYTGIPSNPTVYSAPAGRVPGSIMVAVVEVYGNASNAWVPNCSNGQWTSIEGGGNSSGETNLLKRVADGTSNDDLSITKSAGSTLISVYIIAFNGYTVTAGSAPGGGNQSPQGSSPRPVGTGSAFTASATGLELALVMATGGAAPHTITGPGGGFIALDHKVLSVNSTDPTVDVFSQPINSGASAGHRDLTATGAAGTFLLDGRSLVIA